MTGISDRTMSTMDKALDVLSKNTVRICTCQHRMTIHYYSGYGITEYCLIPNCPCVMYERSRS